MSYQKDVVRDGVKVVGLGMGGATIPVGFFTTPYDASIATTYWGYRQELVEVIEMAKAGRLNVHVERFTIDQAPEAYEKLHHGQLNGRGVIVTETVVRDHRDCAAWHSHDSRGPRAALESSFHQVRPLADGAASVGETRRKEMLCRPRVLWRAD